MNQSNFFKALGAPLTNVRWSWGGIRRDGSVVLRVWRDQMKDGRVCILHPLGPEGQKHNPGYHERIRHIGLIKAGAKCYLVMCTAKDVTAWSRTIASFETEFVYEAGRLLEVNGKYWVELGRALSAGSWRPNL